MHIMAPSRGSERGSWLKFEPWLAPPPLPRARVGGGVADDAERWRDDVGASSAPDTGLFHLQPASKCYRLSLCVLRD